ncbi:hypothetical protein ECH_0101 [Ehrlichia chaffeensis str. Arkansas]|uniref:Uncharacterized protein n=1 Tax=Ehrlichia chaffeensis (strain ATCC CRL-10679 / Arkansas) TaxID=205920 RepID=Q2GI04_EHRCR|nr:hypothetical protein ECH_0101 [Ehrlichia chaffeensis str. Arkansas]
MQILLWVQQHLSNFYRGYARNPRMMGQDIILCKNNLEKY